MGRIHPTERTAVRRYAKRGVYDEAQIYSILDEGLVCHVGFVVDGQPYVIPTIHVRVGNRLYLHGSPASRMLKALAQGIEVCVTVTLVDGLVLARSAMHHSMNYRSAMVFGTASIVENLDEKLRILRNLTEHVAKGRWQETRAPTLEELRRTFVISLPIVEASGKVRTGPPLEDEADYALPFWAGIVPLTTRALEPVPDPSLAKGIVPPVSAVGHPGHGTTCSLEG
jgi:uncharacterized protein